MENEIVGEIEKTEEAVNAAVQGQAFGFAGRLGIAAGIIAAQILLIWLVWFIFRKITAKITANAGNKIKPLTIKKFRLLSAAQITAVFSFLLRIVKYVITLFQIITALLIIFSLFPATEQIASTVIGYILTPLKNIGLGILHFLPNLFTIVIILLIVKYVLKGVKFFTAQIAREKLKLPGFYPDWAQPTYNILRVLLYAFTLAAIFPYLPGSDSRVFQGVSVFVGVIFSLGSTSAIGNLVAGMVITYMRPFKPGDFVQIQDKRGFVVEKTLMVTRIKTTKNEYVTYPNIQILQASITNYNTSIDEDAEGLIVHAEITFGYDTPWRTIHAILLEAAGRTRGVLSSPAPFVLQTALDDFYARYEVNCYTKEVEDQPRIYSELYQNLQDCFAEHGLDMTAPGYLINREG